MDIFIAQFYSNSLNSIVLVITASVDIFLVALVYMSNPRSATNKIFSLLTIFTMLWLVMTYVAPFSDLVPISLTLHRLGIFFAAAMSALFFLLAHTMPSEKIQLRKPVFIALLVATLMMMILNISPYAFTSIAILNGVSSPQPGVGLIPFVILSTLFSGLTVYWLLRKYKRSKGDEKKQFGLVLSGIVIMLALVIATILVPIIYFGSIQFLTFTPLYTLVFLGMTAYAITKYQLFNIKVLLTQALTLVLCIVLFARMFGEETFNAQIIDGLILIVVAVFGFFLVRSVRKEVEQRERIEKLAEELQETNRRQETLMHFVGHEVKGFLTKDASTFAALYEGDFGQLPEPLKPIVSQALTQSRDGARSVTDILTASNQKKGTMTYTKEPFDLKALAEEVIDKAKSKAEEKGLVLSFSSDDSGAPYTFNGDKGKIGDNVLRNIIDNSINYTPHGSVDVSLKKENNKFVISVKDTGVGITEEDKKMLFTEGGHGKDSQKVNVHSTGYGLFIAKNIVEAHGGTIRAVSDGAGKGSVFSIEFPV
ncbi:MAG: ATP-binding protein [bacterium]|nr:ATP-binding protein [bacterium]